MTIELSVVIPVYNVRDYLEECLESVFSLKGFSYEVIIVNDGSTDGSEQIIRLYEDDPRVRVFSQENSGLSAARNVGLRNAAGKYVYFLDSDDFIAPRAFERIFSYGMTEGAEVIVGNYFEYWDADICRENPNRIETRNRIVADGATFLRKYYLHKIGPVVWRSIYMREFLLLHSIFFMEGVYFEDNEWTIRAYTQACKLCYLPVDFHYYRQRDDSIINSDFSLRKLNDCICVCRNLLWHSDKILDSKVKDIYQVSGLRCLFHGLALYKGFYPKQLKDEVTHILKMSAVMEFKFKMMVRIYFFSPRLFLTILRKRIHE